MSVRTQSEDGADPYRELRLNGCLSQDQYGHPVFANALARLIESFDGCFKKLAWSQDAEELMVPATIASTTLRRGGYLISFPHLVRPVSVLSPDASQLERIRTAPVTDLAKEINRGAGGADRVFNPLVCYHVYERLAGVEQVAAPACYTAASPCMREELSATGNPARPIHFRMREIVVVASSSFAHGWRERLMARVSEFCRDLDLPCRLAPASDPFFDGAGLGRLQRIAGLKFELLAEMPAGEEAAISSFNLHGDAFAQRFAIGTGDLHTACVGFGLERWALAVIGRYGSDAGAWPLRAIERAFSVA